MLCFMSLGRVLITCTVARVAYLASDVVVSVQPSLRTDSLFSKPLKSLKTSNARNVLPKGTTEVRVFIDTSWFDSNGYRWSPFDSMKTLSSQLSILYRLGIQSLS